MSAINWIGSGIRRTQAMIHVDDIARANRDESYMKAQASFIYDSKNLPVVENFKNLPTQMVLLKTDAVSTLNDKRVEEATKPAILNFASYKTPGGGYLQGAKAQEEDLCRASDLYNILTCFDEDYYTYNNMHLNRGLYLNRAIYTPNVEFEDFNYCDVISCAAPNWNVARMNGVGKGDNEDCMFDRILFVQRICHLQQVDCLIAGAWGCGVFGQDPKIVCTEFMNIFKESSLKYLIFAIPGGHNYEVFKNILAKNSALIVE